MRTLVIIIAVAVCCWVALTQYRTAPAVEKQGASAAPAAAASIGPIDTAVKSPEEMVDRMRTVLGSSDKAGYLALVHPDCVKQITAETKPFYDQYIKTELGRQIPTDVKVTVLDPPGAFGVNVDKPSDTDGYAWPTKASKLVTLVYTVENGSNRQIISLGWALAEHDGDWRIVLPYPKPGLLDAVKKAQAQADAVRPTSNER
jgi:hypothetical protein